ncbi:MULTISPECIES: DUF2459 domain-containing protein [unclassified Anabaena]|uniref:DUF2459 domain-containing protein n=1 Tax=unclassified Anabaena TaxID=2619674 RepID=UPI0039C6DBB8
MIASPAVIIPPPKPIQPVTVYVIDQGLHSQLVLPDGDNKLIQYAYGDWRYFALNQQNLGSGIAALLIPTQGTLGRREYQNLIEMKQTLNSNHNVLSFAVAKLDVIQLKQLLDKRFNQNIATQIFNPLNKMYFVQDDLDYTLYHNSNHELVVWIEALHCRVEGFVLLADFKISE